MTGRFPIRRKAPGVDENIMGEAGRHNTVHVLRFGYKNKPGEVLRYGGDYMEQRLMEVFEALTEDQKELAVIYVQNLLDTQRMTEPSPDSQQTAD